MSAARSDNLIGCAFRRLLVQRLAGRDGHRNRLWECRCDCGNSVTVPTANLRSGNTGSCGCLNREESVSRCRDRTMHGECRDKQPSSEYRTWNDMIRRCVNPNHAAWQHYGGRGITVCRQWRENFTAFLRDIGRRPSPQHSLDRINNDGNYEPGNCRWATASEQRRNQRERKIDYRKMGAKGTTVWLANTRSAERSEQRRRGWTTRRMRSNV